MGLPTLYTRGAIVVPDGTSELRRAEMMNSIPVKYVANLVNNTPATGPGSRVVILRAGTGSGKSTALPVELFPRGRKIAITQPQRITAEEIPYDIMEFAPQFRMGENIGFQTGLINKTPRTGIVFMTTGILVQQLINQLSTEPERFMRKYSTIMIDEVHKHDLMTDVLLRLVKQLITRFWNHPDCPMIIVQSATLDPKKYMDYFETTMFVDVKGSTFPIEAKWPKTSIADLTTWIVETTRDLKGDTAVFMPTSKSIIAVKKALEEDSKRDHKPIVIEVMGKTLAKGEVKQLMQMSKQNRIVLGTNSMETGLTLPFLANIIDTGLALDVSFNPQYSCTCVALMPVTEASAIQRRGRTGRKFPGTWYPAFTEDTFKTMVKANAPEMYTSDVSAYLLRLIVSLTESRLDDSWRVETRNEFDPATIGLIHDPSQESLSSCYDKLYQLGLIRSDWRPTVTGMLASKMAKTSPETAKMLFASAYHGADLYKLVVISACIEEGGLGDFKGFNDLLFDNIVRCGFIQQLVAFEQLQRRIQSMSVKHMSLAFVEDWCVEVGINYDTALKIIERVYSMTFELMELGLRVFIGGIPLLATLESGKKEDVLQEIRALKKCIMEGYRLNQCIWNESLQNYVTINKHARVSTMQKFKEGPPLNVICNSILYMRSMTGRMEFSMGSMICQLDDHIISDPHFMY